MDNATKKILEIVTDLQEDMSHMQKDMSHMRKDVSDIQKHMATKDDLEEVRRDLQAQITANTKAIMELAEQLRSVFGYAKEIDMLMARMATVEKHLGIRT